MSRSVTITPCISAQIKSVTEQDALVPAEAAATHAVPEERLHRPQLLDRVLDLDQLAAGQLLPQE